MLIEKYKKGFYGRIIELRKPFMKCIRSHYLKVDLDVPMHYKMFSTKYIDDTIHLKINGYILETSLGKAYTKG